VKTALVLSAGGMFGAYQAGVWNALEKALRPDVVIGSSAGSINGWAIASGITGEDLTRLWLDPRCGTLMRKRPAPQRWRSIFDPGPLAEMARELTSTYTPRVPFVLTVTRLPQLRLETVRTPHITWQHIVASCAIPTGYPPVHIDGRLYCDGGLLSVLPVWAAPAFGVERVIAVNVLPSMPLNALRASVRMVRLLAPREPKITGVEMLRLGPPRVLGGLHDAITWEPENIRRWIDRGQADAEALMRGPEFAATESRFV
jgi:NTE family protein